MVRLDRSRAVTGAVKEDVVSQTSGLILREHFIARTRIVQDKGVLEHASVVSPLLWLWRGLEVDLRIGRPWFRGEMIAHERGLRRISLCMAEEQEEVGKER